MKRLGAAFFLFILCRERAVSLSHYKFSDKWQEKFLLPGQLQALEKQ